MSLDRAWLLAASGLTAQRTRMEIVTSNLANVRTTKTADGGPYRRLLPLFVAEGIPGRFEDTLGQALRRVRVAGVAHDTTPFVMRYEPGHPEADERGFVSYPNVDPIREMVDMLSATRSYEANITLVRGIREMSQAALQIVA